MRVDIGNPRRGYEAGINCNHRHVQIQGRRLGLIERSDLGHQFAREDCPRSPVTLFVGAREGTASNRAAKSEVITQAALGAQACLDVAQTLSEGHLCKAKREEVVPWRKRIGARRDSSAGLVGALELPMWDARHDLGEDSLAGVHPASLHPTRPSASNREQLEDAAFVSRTGTYAINSAVKWDSIGRYLWSAPADRRVTVASNVACEMDQTASHPPSDSSKPLIQWDARCRRPRDNEDR